MLDLYRSGWVEAPFPDEAHAVEHAFGLSIVPAVAGDSLDVVTSRDADVSDRPRSATLVLVPTFSATTALPYEQTSSARPLACVRSCGIGYLPPTFTHTPNGTRSR